jgi:hypothetical protein
MKDSTEGQARTDYEQVETAQILYAEINIEIVSPFGCRVKVQYDMAAVTEFDFAPVLATCERVIRRLRGAERDCKLAARRSRMLAIAKQAAQFGSAWRFAQSRGEFFVAQAPGDRSEGGEMLAASGRRDE